MTHSSTGKFEYYNAGTVDFGSNKLDFASLNDIICNTGSMTMGDLDMSGVTNNYGVIIITNTFNCSGSQNFNLYDGSYTETNTLSFSGSCRINGPEDCGAIRVFGSSSFTGSSGVTGSADICDESGTAPTRAGTAADPKVDANSGTTVFDAGVTYCTCDVITLPISLLEFRAEAAQKVVNLRWITASELNNDYFVVERTLDGIHFEEVFRRKGAGNSSSQLSYRGTDHKPHYGVSYYRLRQVDYDGKTTASPLISVYLKSTEPTFNVYPNPLPGGEMVSMDIAGLQGRGEGTISITDLTGKIVYTTSFSWTSSNDTRQTIRFGEGLSAGVYFIHTVIENERFLERLVIR